MSEDFTAVEGVMNLVSALYNNPAPGTGIKKLISFAQNLMGPKVPQVIVEYGVSQQLNLFGGYPLSSDRAPSIAFAVLFGVALVIHTGLFIINCSRGHYFWVSLAWIIYSIFKVIGFALRAAWSLDATKIDIGLTSEVFLIVPAIILVSANLILTQRLFTWRHPVGGSRKLFWTVMFGLYGFVLALIGITIAASFVPYLHFLTPEAYKKWIHVVQFTACCVIAYCFTSVALIGLSFWFPTSKDESLYTYQPWWIESFAPFYFVQKNAAQTAEASFMKRNSNHRHAIRVIAASSHHFKMVKGLTNKRGDLRHNMSMAIIVATTLLILVGAIGRCIVVFQDTTFAHATPAAHPWFMYICWGILEFIVNLIYIFGRVDLRFYRPDILPAAVRAIVTAEQTYYPSSDEEDEGFHRDRPETFAKLKEKTSQPQVEIQPASRFYDAEEETSQKDSSESRGSPAAPPQQQLQQPPYPVKSTGEDFKF
ncbi:hypothetical protein JA1_004778 [Spathaspora sp. JA1]|nr:hypothetical protein JA1_004778 [Spathaspora sp. JA1]